jgi:hypothetical protein
MIGLLKLIYCALTKIPWLIWDAFMWVTGKLLTLLLDALFFLAALLPGMPSVPDPPDNRILGWANWMFPIGPVLGLFTGYLVLYFVARTYLAFKSWADKLGPLMGKFGTGGKL